MATQHTIETLKLDPALTALATELLTEANDIAEIQARVVDLVGTLEDYKIEQQRREDTLLLDAIDAGYLNGKNAEIRDAQRRQLFETDPDWNMRAARILESDREMRTLRHQIEIQDRYFKIRLALLRSYGQHSHEF